MCECSSKNTIILLFGDDLNDQHIAYLGLTGYMEVSYEWGIPNVMDFDTMIHDIMVEFWMNCGTST